MPDLQLEKPFFARASTKRVIGEIGRAQSLCIFVGAGVSVDRTGLTWERLIAHLLVEVDGDHAHFEDARRIVKKLGVLQAGSAVIHRNYEDAGNEQWQDHVCNILRSHLYKHRDRLGGQASRSINLLYSTLLEMRVPSSILTTNYDEHIWLDMEELLTVEPLSGGTRDLRDDPVRYLHGKIPRNGGIPSIDGVKQYPVLSEVDYFERTQSTQEVLYSEFTEKDLLIVGSSLSDRSLIDALLSSRQDASKKSIRRWALIPRSDLDALSRSNVSKEILENHHARLRHLGVEGIYYDYYSQVSQFLTETTIARGLKPDKYSSSNRSHSKRLDRWWKAWYKNISHETDAIKLQNQHHGQLLKVSEELKNKLEALEEEIKVEIWLRWNPSEQNRELRLWASSFARFSRPAAARTASITHDGDLICVKAFQSGKIEYSSPPDNSDDPDPDEAESLRDRWRTLLAIPIRLATDHDLDMIVGVAVVASMAPKKSEDSRSRLHRSKRGIHDLHLSNVRDVARAIVSV